MSFRSLLLRVLFSSLAIAAIFGALGILFGSHDTSWRIASTAIATAVGALLLLGASRTMDDPLARQAALLATTLVVLEYLLILTAIWGQWSLFGSSSKEESLWLTIVFIALVGTPAVALLRMTRSKQTAVAGHIGLVLAAAELTLLLVIAWGDPIWTGNWFGEGLAGWLAPYTVLIVVCLIGRGGGILQLIRWLGATIAALAYSLIAYGLIRDIHHGGNVVIYFTCAAVALLHTNIVLLCPVRPRQVWLRWVTLLAGVATTFFVSAFTHVGNNGNDLFGRIAGACGILAGCGILALLVLARLNRRIVAGPNPMQGVTEIFVVCPICKKKQNLPLGTAACADCRAIIHVRVEEPKCPTCGYSLLMLRSQICPECGTPVPSTVRSPNAEVAPI
jgi:hypothetical protein